MFDFIKRMFHGKTRNSTQPHDVAGLDLVEGNDIEILKTSDYSEGASADAIEQLVADEALPPAELDLPMVVADLPAAELDEPTDESDVSIELDPPDNYLLGDLDNAWKQRAMQTSKAGMQYWNDGLSKYRPRNQRPVVAGTNATQFNYFDVLRQEPMLRKVELQRPGMSIDQLNLQRFIDKSLKGKMVTEYVRRSMKLISEQSENGVIPAWNEEVRTAGGTELRDDHNRQLRDIFNAYESQRRGEAQSIQESQTGATAVDADNMGEMNEIDELLCHFEELLEHSKEDENNQSYVRWLMSVAEDGTASPDILWLLVEDPNPDVRFCLAENYDIDADILKALSEDENPYVAHRAQKTLMRLQNPAGKVVDRDFGMGEINRRRKSG